MVKNAKKIYVTVIVLLVITGAAAFFSGYLSFVRKVRDKEVASQMSEVYGQMNTRFNELSQKSWNLLYDGTLAYELSGSEDLIDAYVSQLKAQWSFNEWMFVNDNGSYIDTHGHTGYLNLGKDYTLLVRDKERIVVDGTLAGSEPVMLFAIPAAEGVYKDFKYTAVALAYDKSAMEAVLKNNSYDGQAKCYICYTDGRILMSLQESMGGNKNLYTILKTAQFKGTDFDRIHSGIKNGETGTYRYEIDDNGYYLYYQPVGFQNWMMVGIVPQKIIGIYLDQILSQTVALSALCFALVMTAVIIYMYYRSRRAIARKNQELNYRQRMFDILSSNTSNMFIVVIPDVWEIEYVSSNSENVLGISSEEIVKDMSVLESSKCHAEERFEWEQLANIPLGATVEVESERIHGKTGETLYIEEMIHHVKIGDIERFIFLMQDRTKERENQKNLKMALDIARTANESKSAFLSNMSHDIRTPMNVIIGFLPLLQRDANHPEKVREYAGKIGISSQHLLGLINDILDMSKIESGKTSLNLTEFNIAELIDGIAAMVRPQAAAKQQSFDIYVKDIRHEYLIGDSMKINQILMNILSNAVKYTQAGGHIRLEVQQLSQTTKNIAQVRFTVSDDGIGMSEDYQKVIFEPFTREADSKVAKARGTGLGMSIVKNLVDLMGGSISLRSCLGEGSTFIVELGLRIQEEEIDALFWEKHSLLRTLVVDNDIDVCKNVVQTVLHSGLEMDYALSGMEAIDKVRMANAEKKSYNLVLLDWKMPHMDGLETAVRIREIVPEDVPIFILTAYDWSEIEDEANAAGINGFMAKPFFLSNFKDTVEHLCQEPEESTVVETGRYLKGKHFLVAEDYELNAEILEGILEMYGATCDICENGLETLKRFEESPSGTYDMILMDIQMPVMNGCEATEAIRGSIHPEAKTIPITAMSANAFSEDVQNALAAGMDAYLTKPVDVKRLEEVLAKLLVRS